MDTELAACDMSLARKHLRLLEFDFEVVHQAGVKHQVAEVLSLSPTSETNKTQVEDEVPVLTIAEVQRESKKANGRRNLASSPR